MKDNPFADTRWTWMETEQENKMNKPITITATLPAWLPAHERIGDLMRYIKDGKPEMVANMLAYSICDMDKGSNPWARAGEAQITVTLSSQDDLVKGQLAALQAELAHERAESQQRQNALLDRISKLSALEYSEPT